MTTLAEPLARALTWVHWEEPDGSEGGSNPPTTEEVLASLRADPATLTAMAEALCDEAGPPILRDMEVSGQVCDEHRALAARILDRLFGSPESGQ
jgi:hypothetical protein